MRVMEKLDEAIRLSSFLSDGFIRFPVVLIFK